jgi:hypothetical protein
LPPGGRGEDACSAVLSPGRPRSEV